MAGYMLSPSIFVADLLNLGHVVRQLDEMKCDMLHLDMIDTTFSNTVGLPPDLLPAIREISDTPFDVHLMTAVPEVYLPRILPYCKDSFVCIHIEVAKEFNWLAHEIREAGARPGVVINSTTPPSAVEEVLPMVDLVQVMLCDASRPMKIPEIQPYLYPKVERVRKMCNKAGFPEMIVQCDAGITFEMAKELLARGANSFVLGRDSIFMNSQTVTEKIGELREYLAG